MTDILNILTETDTWLLLLLNSWHCAWADNFMMLVSSRFAWILFYASFLFVMARNYPALSVTKCLLAIVAIVVLCDQTASGLIKPLVERMRPSNPDNPIAPMVNIVKGYRGGPYGFPSSHAANAWGMAFFAMYLVRNAKLNTMLMLWAATLSYSRIYMGVHYPGDILVGTLIGFCYASLCYSVLLRIDRQTVKAWHSPEHARRQEYLPFAAMTLTLVAIMVASTIMMLTGSDILIV